MVMPISGVTAAASLTSVAPTSGSPTPTAADGFTDKIAGAMQSVSDSIADADSKVQDVAAGGLGDATAQPGTAAISPVTPGPSSPWAH